MAAGVESGSTDRKTTSAKSRFGRFMVGETEWRGAVLRHGLVLVRGLQGFLEIEEYRIPWQNTVSHRKTKSENPHVNAVI